jgi:hypothetical protein
LLQLHAYKKLTVKLFFTVLGKRAGPFKLVKIDFFPKNWDIGVAGFLLRNTIHLRIRVFNIILTKAQVRELDRETNLIL